MVCINNFEAAMVERLEDKKWYYLSQNMKELKSGDVFRIWHLIDDKWVLYEDSLGYTKWAATSNPYFEDDYWGWGVKCKRLT